MRNFRHPSFSLLLLRWRAVVVAGHTHDVYLLREELHEYVVGGGLVGETNTIMVVVLFNSSSDLDHDE